MNGQQMLQQKTAAYEQIFQAALLARMGELKMLSGQTDEVDVRSAIQQLDPALIRSEFDAALRTIASDFAMTFNDMLTDVVRREPAAKMIVGKYYLQPSHVAQMEGAMRSQLPPVYSALAEVAAARSAFLAFSSNQGTKAVGMGFMGGKVGAVIGSAILPGVGTFLGAVIGGALAGHGVDEQAKQLTQDWAQRWDAFTTAAQTVVGTLAAGSRVKVQDESVPGWLKVRLNDGTTGWMSAGESASQ